jgi:hypothetical protein
MKAVHVLILSVVAATSISVHALPGDGDRFGGERRAEFRNRVDGIRAGMFAEFKAIESYSHKERIRILQEAESCNQAARDRDQYRACEDREKQSREQVQAQVKARHDALRARAEGLRNGMLSRN